MAVSHIARPSARRAFIVTPYHPDDQGILHPQMPESCPRRSSGDTACRLSLHHVRKRKTGPCFGLTVLRCSVHGRGFTLYPPGFGPYQRQAVLRLAPDGSAVIDDDRSASKQSSDGVTARALRDFEGTVFQAALDAREGRAWARDSDGGLPEAWWSTQGRHLALAARIVGVADDLQDPLRSTRAYLLEVDQLLLQDGARSVSASSSYRRIGEAVCEVLGAMRPGRWRAAALLLCGHLVGLWGKPVHWDPRGRCFAPIPFPLPDTGKPP